MRDNEIEKAYKKYLNKSEKMTSIEGGNSWS
jgi:hypothetical protein